MDIRDALLGKVVVVSTTLLFGVLVLWLNTYPFIHRESPILSLIPNPQWCLVLCAAWGLLFIGGLMSFTLYHIYPYL